MPSEAPTSPTTRAQLAVTVETAPNLNGKAWKERGIGIHGLSLEQSPWQEKTMWTDCGASITLVKKEEARFRKHGDPAWIFPQVTINSLSNIDGVSQTFDVRYTLFVNSTITEVDFNAFVESPTTWTPSWVPVVMPYNAAKVDKNEHVLNPDGSKYFLNVQRGHWCAGTFLEQVVTYKTQFDLRNFPFDTQELDMKFEIRDFHFSWNFPRPQVKVKSEPYYAPNGNSASFQNIWVPPSADWYIDSSWIQGEAYMPNADSWGPAYQVVVKAQRRWAFFAWRVVFLLSLLSLAVTMTPVMDDIGDALGYVSGLLVAAVAFLFSIISYLPSVGYLTLLDKYIFSIFVFIFLTAVAVAAYQVAIKAEHLQHDNAIDAYIGGGSFLVWASIHLVFALFGLAAYTIERRKLRLLPHPGRVDEDPLV